MGVHANQGALEAIKRPDCQFAAPCLGEHNEYVFKEVIGLSDDEIARLEKEEIIGGTAYKEYAL